MAWAVFCSKVMALLLLIHCLMNTNNIFDRDRNGKLLKMMLSPNITENKSDYTLSSAE